MKKIEILQNYKLDTDDQNELNFGGLYDLLLDHEIATSNELELICSINGNNVKALLDVLYVRTGLRSIEQLLSELAE